MNYFNTLFDSYDGSETQQSDDATDSPPPTADMFHSKRKTLNSLYISGKCKLIGSLYNIVHSNTTELPLFTDSPIYLLGSVSNDILKDFENLIWFCYRKDFSPLEPSQLTTDIGWGCMLRTGQMIVAQGLVRHILGRDWKMSEQDQSPKSKYRHLLQWFADNPKSTYSIHNIVVVSKQIDQQHIGHSITSINRPGEYFTPTRVCKIFKCLVRHHSPSKLTMHVAKDAVIYKDKVEALCSSSKLHTVPSPKLKRKMKQSKEEEEEQEEDKTKEENEKKEENKNNKKEEKIKEMWRPMIILIPLRLGVDKVNSVYIPQLKSVLQCKYSLGIIGGRPKQSYYFVGFQEEQVLYLDPHIVKPSPRPDAEFVDTYHCNIPRVMPFESLDPSLALGFYCANKEDWNDFCRFAADIVESSDGSPLFTIEEETPDYAKDSDDELEDVVIM